MEAPFSMHGCQSHNLPGSSLLSAAIAASRRTYAASAVSSCRMSRVQMCAGRAPLAWRFSHSMPESHHCRRPYSLLLQQRCPERSSLVRVRPTRSNLSDACASAPLHALAAHCRVARTSGEGIGQSERYNDRCGWGWAESDMDWVSSDSHTTQGSHEAAQESTGGEGGGQRAGNGGVGGGGWGGDGWGGFRRAEGGGGDEGNIPHRLPRWIASWIASLQASWHALYRWVSQLALSVGLSILRLSCRNLLLVIPLAIELGSGSGALPVLWAFLRGALRGSLAAVCVLFKELGDAHAAFAQGSSSYTSAEGGTGTASGGGRYGEASRKGRFGDSRGGGFGAKRFREFREFWQQQGKGADEEEEEEGEAWGSEWGAAKRKHKEGGGRRSFGWGQANRNQGDFDDDLLQWLIAAWLSGQVGARGRKFRFGHPGRGRGDGQAGVGDGRREKGRRKGGMGSTGAGAGAGPHGMRHPGTMPGESAGPDWDQFARHGRGTSYTSHSRRHSDEYSSEWRGSGDGQQPRHAPRESSDTSWEEFSRQRQRRARHHDHAYYQYQEYRTYSTSQGPHSGDGSRYEGQGKEGQRAVGQRDTCQGACERWAALSTRVLASSSQQQQQEQEQQPSGGVPATATAATVVVHIQYTDIPWPPLGNPLCLAQGDTPGEVRRKVREGLLRWHPDKFQAQWGPHLAPCDARLTLARAARLGREVLELHRRHAARREEPRSVQ